MFKLSHIAKKINGKLIGPDKNILRVSEINDGDSCTLSFIDNPLYLKYYSSTKCGALIVSEDFKDSRRKEVSLIRVKKPRLGLLKAIKFIHNNMASDTSFKYETSFIHHDASIGSNLNLESFNTIQNGVKLGDNVRLGNNCIISENSTIGNNVILHNNVVVEKNCTIGDNTIIQSGTVIGSDGFGTVVEDGKHLNFPHIGNVIIGSDVWIGSNVTIDRGTIGKTIVGDNTKIDNLVQIAHNVEIGQSCIIVSGAAIAGTSKIGDNVSIGGQVGIVGHITIGDNCMIGAKSLVTKSFSKGLFLSGNPAKIHKDRVKEEIALRKLPNYMKKIIKL